MPGGGMASRCIIEDDLEAFRAEGYGRLLDEMRNAGLLRLVEGWAMADPRGLWGNAHALVHLDPGFLDAFLALDIPRTFVIGEKSLAKGPTPDAPDPDMLKAAGIATHVIAGAGHAMMYDDPEAFSQALLAAFPGLDGASAPS